MGAVVQHELMHTLGFLHEHVRPDRDQYVDVDFKKLTKVKSEQEIEDNYDIKRTEAVTLSPYDYVSVLHYGRKWISVKKKGAVIFDPANNYGLSELDIKHLNELYNCPNDKDSET